jgi:DNA polymerase III delta prime subunit
MSRFLQLIIQLLTNAVTAFIGYLINQISSIDTIAKSGASAKDIKIFWLIVVGVMVIAFINFANSSSSENQSQSNSSIKALALASGIPVTLSLVLYFGLRSGFLPLQYSQEIFYVALGLIIAGGVLPSLIMWREAKYRNRQQQTPTNATINLQSSNILKQKLLEFVSDEVDLRCRNSLHNLVMIDLSMQEQPQQVGQPLRPVVIPDKKPESFLERILLKFGNSPSKTPIEPTKKVIEVFREVYGKLLILGMPGSGKTTILLDLAKELCAEAQKNEDKPVPVIFELSNWEDEKQSIADWLDCQIKLRYEFLDEIYTIDWLKNHKLLPLFDGLDELGLERQILCVKAINKFVQDYPLLNLVVCCRRVEYQKGKVKLDRLHEAVFLKPFNPAQIQDYLKRVGKSSLWSNIKKNQELQRLAKSPLLLSMMVVAYKEPSMSNRKELFNTYINYQVSDKRINKKVYSKGRNSPSPKQTLYWLSWLAKTLKAESKTEFLIENLQPTYLRTLWQKLLYYVITGCISGFIVGIIFSIVWAVSVVLIVRPIIYGMILAVILAVILVLTCGLISGLIFGLIFGLMGVILKSKSIQPLERLEFNLRKVITGDFIPRVIGASLGFGMYLGTQIGIIRGIILGLIFGIIFGIIPNLRSTIEIRQKPNEGIWGSAKNSIIVILINVPVWMIICLLIWPTKGINFGIQSLLPWLENGNYRNYELDNLFLQVIFTGFIFCSYPFFLPVIQHFALRLVLWSNGYIPWNYARFLDYATELRFMQKVGGRYRFIHDLLREHFAELPLTKK